MARTTTWPSVRECGVCGRTRKIKRAAVDGDPDMCQACWKRDPRSWRVCSRCEELRPSQGRDRQTGGPICERCYRRTRPVGVCDHCGQLGQLARTGGRGGPKLCVLCVSRELRPVRTCGRCGRVAKIAVRFALDGTRDLCFRCYAQEPRGVCGRCGQPAALRVRGRDGQPDLCQRCYRQPIATCSRCGRQRPCSYAHTDQPVCDSCKPRRIAVCVLCGRERGVKAKTVLGPICQRCEWRRLKAKAICERCGQLRRPAIHAGSEVLCGDCAGIPQSRVCQSCGTEDMTYYRGLCPRCSLRRCLDDLRAQARSEVLARLGDYLAELEQRPGAEGVLQWLNKPGGHTLQAILRGQIALSHEGLDGVPGKSTDQLRATLAHAGVLELRDEVLAALERFTTQRLAGIAPGPDHTMLRRFATWKIQRELAARRARRSAPDVLASQMPRVWIARPIELTAWLHGQNLTLADLDQAQLDRWLADGRATRRNSIRPFIAWLERNHARRGLRVPAPTPGTAINPLDDQQRLAALRRLLADDTLDPAWRVAGCLVALYAQPVARIVRLTSDDLDVDNDTITVKLGRDPVPLPAALHPAVAVLRDRAAAQSSPWLFAGQKPGYPTHPAHLGRRLRLLGIPVPQARGSAMAALAHRIPAPVLAEVLGFSASTAARVSVELKVDYATYVAGRTSRSNR